MKSVYSDLTDKTGSQTLYTLWKGVNDQVSAETQWSVYNIPPFGTSINEPSGIGRIILDHLGLT